MLMSHTPYFKLKNLLWYLHFLNVFFIINITSFLSKYPLGNLLDDIHYCVIELHVIDMINISIY